MELFCVIERYSSELHLANETRRRRKKKLYIKQKLSGKNYTASWLNGVCCVCVIELMYFWFFVIIETFIIQNMQIKKNPMIRYSIAIFFFFIVIDVACFG